jgi:hypothetical protein
VEVCVRRALVGEKESGRAPGRVPARIGAKLTGRLRGLGKNWGERSRSRGDGRSGRLGDAALRFSWAMGDLGESGDWATDDFLTPLPVHSKGRRACLLTLRGVGASGDDGDAVSCLKITGMMEEFCLILFTPSFP